MFFISFPERKVFFQEYTVAITIAETYDEGKYQSDGKVWAVGAVHHS